MQKTLDFDQSTTSNKININININSSFQYTIRDTECNSKVFGACEICGKDAVQVFHQKKIQYKFRPDLNRNVGVQVTDCYGHYNCLIQIRN